MTGTIAKHTAAPDGGRIARPLRVLVPLIREDLESGKQAAEQAAEQAGMPYYQAAGEKMLEAKPQMPHGQFQSWITRNFRISYKHAHKYMQLATAADGRKSFVKDFSSLSDFIRQTSSPTYNKPAAWQENVKRVINRVDTETLNLKREELKRADERDAQRELALQLIDIGYKVLAQTLHPDKGGSREAMTRLNAVRERLKQHV